jgi:tetratricopeptide (TPR) repeat protein
MSHVAAPVRYFRRSLSHTLILALCLAPVVDVGLGVRIARAQDGETEVARQRFLEGVRHYDQKEYEKARLAFLQAYLLKPHRAVLLNLAQSELKAGRYAEAAENFAKYIRENPTADAMDHAKAAFEEARQKVGEVNIEVNATGAILNVDGADVGKSPLPYAVYVMPGRHTVRATSKSGLSADESLEAVAGQHVYVTLALPEGSRMSPPLAAAAGPAAAPIPAKPSAPVAKAPVLKQTPLPSDTAAAEPQHSHGFFGWIADSPGAIATVTVAGLALGTSAVLAGFANNRYAAANDARDQIEKALQDNVANHVLVGTAVPCGADGVASKPDSFDSRVNPDDVKYLTGAFANACSRFTERSNSGDRLKTLSLVSLGVGAFAAVGTVVWYFSDSGGQPTETAKNNTSFARHRAHVTPMLSRDGTGVWVDFVF